MRILDSIKYRTGLLIGKMNPDSNRNFLQTKDLRLNEVDPNFLNYSFKDVPFKLRRGQSSDYSVMVQVLYSGEYAVIHDVFKSNGWKLKTMIDAGSNIGLTSLYLKVLFPEASIVCIEPDASNMQRLKENVSTLNAKQDIHFLQAGLMGKDGVSLSISSAFRDGKDWAKKTQEIAESDLKSITISTIQEQYNFAQIDLLKIDIEGAEVFLLEKETSVAFLKNTRVIAIEIHDEFNCRQGIYDLLRSNGFVLFNSGELTIGINTHLA